MKLTKALALTLGLATAPAWADTVREANMTGQVSVFMDAGKVTSCGLTLVAFEKVSELKGKLEVFNGSFSIFSRGGLAKGRASELDVTAYGKSGGGDVTKHVKPLKTEHFWFKAAGGPATSVMQGQKYTPSKDDPGYYIYVTTLEPYSGLLGAVFEGKPIQIGYKVAGRNVGSVLFGVVQLTDAEHEQLTNCVQEWADVASKEDE